ncbi:proteasome complex subunit Rpn13 ubiquitin receptor-domain-containing protein [Echria macrotheca]|uniref:Proteasome complex subunit Rpn13 ubiquitin receptor-domain-containing protein n=1 Tax=Echria macrotheca TaxID=438768 RepID=A0AAJ0BB04_9PEZI|nr:proteasome complex subunit Rpn13 ubiquitin receptor-domain-containing protein [Echria macrotheca]
MSINPIITFKAGKCELDQSSKPYKVKPDPTRGYISLWSEDDLIHFCWRPRNVPLDTPEIDLIMVPTDGRFVPYDTRTPKEPSSKTNGRIFVLKFSSSSQRHMFWLQSKPQGRSGNPAWFSPRDLKLGELVDKLLQGEEVDVGRELSSIQLNNNDDDEARDDDDEPMEDVEGTGDPHDHHESGDGGAGPDATGGDFRKEGEDSREGGADGARAASANSPVTDAAAAVRRFLESLQSGNQGATGSQAAEKLYPTLSELLDTSATIPMVDAASDEYVNGLLAFLPPMLLVLVQQGDNGDVISQEPSRESITAAQEAMSSSQKRALVKKVLRSPQFHQSLASFSVAIRDGGLPSIADSLGINVEDGGFVKGGTMPLGGARAMEAFVNGVKRTVQKNNK